MMFKDLIRIDKRWSFRLGACFDEELFAKNLKIVKFICDTSQKLNLKYVFSGTWGLALNSGYAYRDFKDLDVIIDRSLYKLWSNILLENGWRYCGYFENDNIPLSIIEDFTINNSEKFASINQESASSKSETATTYTYIKNKLCIEETKNIINNCDSRKEPRVFIHDPSKDIVFGKDSFKFVLKMQNFSGIGNNNCFLYYTEDGSIPNGKDGIENQNTKISILKLKKIDDQFAIWESEDFDLKLINKIFKYKISIFYGFILRFANQDEFIIDLIIDSPRRLLSENMDFKTYQDNLKIYYSKPDLIWVKKMLYKRSKDLMDEKYYKKIITTY